MHYRDFALTPEVAEAFFEEHADQVLAEIDDLPMPTTDRYGCGCPIAVLIRARTGLPQPGVCASYWSPDIEMENDLSTRIAMHPVIARFIHLVDRSGVSWSGTTGQFALNLLLAAKIDIAHGRSPNSY